MKTQKKGMLIINGGHIGSDKEEQPDEVSPMAFTGVELNEEQDEDEDEEQLTGGIQFFQDSKDNIEPLLPIIN